MIRRHWFVPRPLVVVTAALAALAGLSGCGPAERQAAPVGAFIVNPVIDKLDLNADGTSDYVWTHAVDPTTGLETIRLTSPTHMGLELDCSLAAGVPVSDAVGTIPGHKSSETPGRVFTPNGTTIAINGAPYSIMLTGNRGFESAAEHRFIDYYALTDWSMGILAQCVMSDTDDFKTASTAATKWLAYWVSASVTLDNDTSKKKYGTFIISPSAV